MVTVAETNIEPVAFGSGRKDRQVQRQIGGLDQALSGLRVERVGIRGALSQPQGIQLEILPVVVEVKLLTVADWLR